MNAWFPRLNVVGTIYSGNAGIWEKTINGQPKQISPVGIGPIWSGLNPVYNLNNNKTQYGVIRPEDNQIINIAYNGYVGSDIGQWAGTLPGQGKVDRYNGTKLIQSIDFACNPGFAGGLFGYLIPFQTTPDNPARHLIIDGSIRQYDIIGSWTPDKNSSRYVFTVEVGYEKIIYSDLHQDVTIRKQHDEYPQVLFTGPDGYPTMLSQINSGTFVRMIYSAFGYYIPGDFYYPDARMIEDKLYAVGSDNAGNLKTFWVDFKQPKIDLRLV